MFRVKSQSLNPLSGVTVSVTIFLACSLFVAHAAGLTAGKGAGQAGSGVSPAQRLAQGQTGSTKVLKSRMHIRTTGHLLS